MSSVPLTPSVAALLELYRHGLFPMAGDDGEVGIYSPDPRGVLQFEDYSPGRTLRNLWRRHPFELWIDRDFPATIAACATRGASVLPEDAPPQAHEALAQEEDSTWLSSELEALYTAVHRAGHAHSIEAWRGSALVGGLYGVSIGGVFFGESMFHIPPAAGGSGASNVCLLALLFQLRRRRFALLDTQWLTPHLRRFAGVYVPRSEYLARLAQAVAIDTTLTGSSDTPPKPVRLRFDTPEPWRTPVV